MPEYDPKGFRRIPANDKGYPGMTELSRDGITVQCMGAGDDVEQALIESAENRQCR